MMEALKIILSVILIFFHNCDCTGYRSQSSLGYGYSGTAGAYPVVHYPPPIHPPSTGYANQQRQQQHVPDRKLNNGGGYEIHNNPVHPISNSYGGGDINKIYPPSSYGGKRHGYDEISNIGNGADLSDPCFSRYPNCLIGNHMLTMIFFIASAFAIYGLLYFCFSQRSAVRTPFKYNDSRL